MAAADRVQTGLDVVATAADRVQTGLDAAATDGDRAQTGLDRTATGADAIATAADRVQTGLDAASAAASASSIDTATLLNRANHTGTQTASTISDFSTATDARITAGIGSTIQAYSAALTAIAGLAVTDGNFIVGNGTTWVAESGATARTSLGLGTAATQATSAFATSAQGTKADAALARTGGTMTGKITLDGAPSSDLHAATKKYVDDNGGGLGGGRRGRMYQARARSTHRTRTRQANRSR